MLKAKNSLFYDKKNDLIDIVNDYTFFCLNVIAYGYISDIYEEK